MTLPYFNPYQRRFDLAPKEVGRVTQLYFIIVFRTKSDPNAQGSALKNRKLLASDISPQGSGSPARQCGRHGRWSSRAGGSESVPSCPRNSRIAHSSNCYSPKVAGQKKKAQWFSRQSHPPLRKGYKSSPVLSLLLSPLPLSKLNSSLYIPGWGNGNRAGRAAPKGREGWRQHLADGVALASDHL